MPGRTFKQTTICRHLTESAHVVVQGCSVGGRVVQRQALTAHDAELLT